MGTIWSTKPNRPAHGQSDLSKNQSKASGPPFVHALFIGKFNWLPPGATFESMPPPFKNMPTPGTRALSTAFGLMTKLHILEKLREHRFKD